MVLLSPCTHLPGPGVHWSLRRFLCSALTCDRQKLLIGFLNGSLGDLGEPVVRCLHMPWEGLP